MKCPESLLQCKDLKCEQQSHNKARDDLVLDVLCAIVETSYTCLPLTGRAGGAKTGDNTPRATEAKILLRMRRGGDLTGIVTVT